MLESDPSISEVLLSGGDPLMLTKKAKYGLKAMVHLARLAPGAGASIGEVAQANDLPKKFLEAILVDLRNAGFVQSRKGRGGGYALARPAIEITAFEVIRAIDGPLFITSCITIHGACDLTSHCTIKEPLRKVNDSIKDLLSGIRIADLIEATDTEQTGAKVPVGGGLVSIAL